MAKTEAQNSGRLRAVVFLLLALVAGAAATIMIYQLIQGYQARIAEAQKPEETVVCIIAATDLFPGVTINEQDIRGLEIPKRYVPADAFTSPELVVGRVPRERILANEFLRPERLADGESGVGLNALIAPGMRAISINIADGKALSGFLQPGNRVDVLVTMNDETTDERTTGTLFQTMPILAVNNKLLKEQADDDERSGRKRHTVRAAPSVTFMVTPEQAEKVAQAEKTGAITLTLRNDDDLAVVDVPLVSVGDLVPHDKKASTEPRPVHVDPKPTDNGGSTIQIIRQGAKSGVQLGGGGNQ